MQNLWTNNCPWNIKTHSCILFKPTASPRPKEVAKCISTVKTTNCTSNKLDSLNQGSLLYGATWRIHLLHLGCTNRQHNWKRFDQDRHKMSQMSTYTLKSVDYWMLWLVQMRFLTPMGQTLLSQLNKMCLKLPFIHDVITHVIKTQVPILCFKMCQAMERISHQIIVQESH